MVIQALLVVVGVILAGFYVTESMKKVNPLDVLIIVGGCYLIYWFLARL
jgi:hypothetical protein